MCEGIMMTPYNYTADRPLCRVEGESSGNGFMPVSGRVRDVQKNAVIQAGTAFKNEGDQIYSALKVLDGVISYLRKEGFAALSADKDFRGDRPYVLDLIEEKEQCKIPLRKYLEFGLEHLSCGQPMELLEELMANKYYTNSYAGADAFTAYLYFMGVKGMSCGMPFDRMLEYLASLIPDAEADAFAAFAGERRKREVDERYRHMCETLKQKFERWDADRDMAGMDKNGMMTIFNEMTSDMSDDFMKELIQKMSGGDICYSLLGADGENRKHVMGLLTKEHRLMIMERWMDMQFGGETAEKCMEAVGRVIRIWVIMQKGQAADAGETV